MRFTLNEKQKEKFADIFSSLGIIFFATVITPLFTVREAPNLPLILLGLVLFFVFVSVSIVLLRKYDTKS